MSLAMAAEASVEEQSSIRVADRKEKRKYNEVWDLRSSIRTRPIKLIDFSAKGYFFPEEKQPILLNQRVMALGEGVKSQILLQSFFKYLNDVVHLEVRQIVSACEKIIYSDLPIEYSEDVKMGALTVIVDEFYHVYLAKDMEFQIRKKSPELPRFQYPVSDASHAMSFFKERIDARYHDVFEIIAVCIFETTLVRELVEFFNSPKVHPSILHYVNDHMNDEARHFSFFYDLLRETWAKLPSEFQDSIGSQLAEFIKMYLHVESDKLFYRILLDHFLDDEGSSVKVVDEIYHGFDITPEVPIVKNVIKVLKSTRILDHESVQTGFRNVGWNLG